MQPHDLCTYEQVLGYMPVGQTLDDELVERLITAASVAIMRVAEREFATHDATIEEGISGAPDTVERDPAVRVFPVGPHRASRVVPVGDMAVDPTQIDLVDEDGATVSADISLSGVQSMPFNRAPWEPITALRFPAGALAGADAVAVTSEWGFPQVPEDIRQACIAQVREWYMRDISRVSQGFGDNIDDGAPVAARELSLVARDAARAYRYLMVR